MKRLATIFLMTVLLICISACEQKPVQTEPTTTVPITEPTSVPTEAPMDAQTLLDLLCESLERAPVTQYDVHENIELTVGTMGFSFSMGVSRDGMVWRSEESGTSYQELLLNINAFGMDTAHKEQVYTRLEDDKKAIYQYIPDVDSWSKKLSDVAEGTYYDHILPDSMSLEEETQILNGREVYVLHCRIDGSCFVEEADIVAGFSGVTEEGDVIPEIDFSVLYGECTAYVDAQTYCLLKEEIDIVGLSEIMTQVMDSLMKQQLEEFEDMLPGEIDVSMTVDVPTYHMSRENIGYDPVEVKQISEEGIIRGSQTLFEPDQGDGTYILQESGDAVRITIPDDIIVPMAEYNLLYMYQKDAEGSNCTYEMRTGPFSMEDELNNNIELYQSLSEDDISSGTEVTEDGYECGWFSAYGNCTRIAAIPVGEEGILLLTVNSDDGSDPKTLMEAYIDCVQEHELDIIID